jgi:hypothetical protein
MPQIMRIFSFFSIAFWLCHTFRIAAQSYAIPLWINGAPGSEPHRPLSRIYGGSH